MNDVEKSKQKILRSNLSLDKRKALSELAAQNNIVISNADKSGPMVIQLHFYLKEAVNFYPEKAINQALD